MNTLKNPLRIRKVAVLGAGVMGVQIAAHLINARVPVLLFDLPAKEGSRNGIALRAVEQIKALNPAPLGLKDDAQYLEVANYDDDLARLAECDLVIEAIAERMDWKHALYARIAPHLAPQAILASNTSGLSIAGLSAGLDATLQARFCGVHFFNPPRYMHLVELIPTTGTCPELLDQLEDFLVRVLGKGVVRAKDTPNFIANRVGIFSILSIFRAAEHYDIPFDVVDDLTGARMGRAKSGTFRTADVVGLDTMLHVIHTMQATLSDDPFAACYATPPVLTALVEKGALGQKSGAGFYRKLGKTIQVLDPASGEYRESTGKANELVARILKRPPAERYQLLRSTSDPQAQFLWAITRDAFHYIAVHLQDIAECARDVDLAVRWGFARQEGPFEEWQAAGWTQIAQWVKEDIDAGKALVSAPLPDWVFSGPVAQAQGVHTPDGSWSPAHQAFIGRSASPVYARQIFRPPVYGETVVDARQAGQTIEENGDIRIWTTEQDEQVLILSFKTKMNTIGPVVLQGIQHAVALAEQGYKGLVIWQPTSLKLGMPGGPFSAGANLEAALPMMMQGGPAAVEPFIAAFQQTMQCVKYAQVPVVVALAGIALGGGCELALHAARRVAAFETYIGLVEIGVGLLPAGGGLKEAAIAAAEAAQAAGSSQYLNFLTSRFQAAATAKVSGNALEAKQMGYLKVSDPVVLNVFELLGASIREARVLYENGYRPPLPSRGIPVAGRSGMATIQATLVNMRDGGLISAHDFLIASRIAAVMCGGELEAGSLVNENWLLTLERRAFVELLGYDKTQERIMSLLQGGKPVRN